jgi:hypothetical protein
VTLTPPDDPIVEIKGAGAYHAQVIDLAGVRIKAGLPKSVHKKTCKHHTLTYCRSDRRVWCDDCSRTIEPFDALLMMIGAFADMERDAARKMLKADEAMASTVRRRSAKELDRAWSGNLPAVCCPHCRKGILPEDFDGGIGARTSREYEMARRKREREGK